MEKIGILGGTFNPIHKGHLMMAKQALEAFSLSEVWFMPSKRPPHKDVSQLVSDEDRCRMIELSIAGNQHFRLSRMELLREGITYTVDTLMELKKEKPKAELYFILGADSLYHIEEWKEPDKIMELAHILSAPRYPTTLLEDKVQKEYLEEKYHAKIQLIPMEPMRVSSESIRAMLKCGQEEALSYLEEPVFDYIREQKLYPYIDRQGIRKQIKSSMPGPRFLHTVGVENTAACLAMRYGADMNLAALAGLLHDCAKNLSKEEMLSECEKSGLTIRDVERRQPHLLHGRLGAYYAKTRYGIDEDSVLDAITYHTTGRVGMTLLEEIIFIADYIEPSRKEIPGLSEVRRLAFVNLSEAIYLTLKNTLEYLEAQKKGEIDSVTYDSYLYYKEKVEKK
jgi:nicotinate-nucleotide adenylyltransferase